MNIRCSCGHDDDVVLVGDRETRDSKIAWIKASGKCKKCFKMECRMREEQVRIRLAALMSAANPFEKAVIDEGMKCGLWPVDKMTVVPTSTTEAVNEVLSHCPDSMTSVRDVVAYLKGRPGTQAPERRPDLVSALCGLEDADIPERFRSIPELMAEVRVRRDHRRIVQDAERMEAEKKATLERKIDELKSRARALWPGAVEVRIWQGGDRKRVYVNGPRMTELAMYQRGGPQPKNMDQERFEFLSGIVRDWNTLVLKLEDAK